MKSVLFSLLVAVIILSGCSPKENDSADMATDEPAIEVSVPLEGAWRMRSRITYENGLPVDTVNMGENFTQVKMYVDGSVMWSQMTPKDSAKWYGYGTYMVQDGGLIEMMEYGSDEFMVFLQTQNRFEFELIIEDDSYTQLGRDSLGLIANSEIYRRVN